MLLHAPALRPCQSSVTITHPDAFAKDADFKINKGPNLQLQSRQLQVGAEARVQREVQNQGRQINGKPHVERNNLQSEPSSDGAENEGTFKFLLG